MKRESASHHAFAMLDILITLALLAVIATIALPALQPSDTLRMITAANTLAADIEYAQSISMSEPAALVSVQFDPDTARYWLAREATPDTPIERGDGSPYEVSFGEGTAEYLRAITLRLDEPKGAAGFTFDAFGRLKDESDALIVLGGATGELAVRVKRSTGSVMIGQ